MDVNGRLKQRRKQLGISAEELAERIGVCPATVYRYESRQIQYMRVEKLKPIADALHTTPEWLMGWTEDPEGAPAGPDPLSSTRPVPPGTHPANLPPAGTAWDHTMICQREFSLGAHICPGDLVYLRRCDRPAPGSIAALAWQGTVSLYRFCASEDWIVLMTSDWTTPPVVLSPGEMEHVQVLGQVVGYLHSL